MIRKLAFRVEYARTGRSKCKKNQNENQRGRLAYCSILQFKKTGTSSIHTGWFHPVCFFIVNRPQTIGDIDGFPIVRTDEHNNIRKEIGN